MNKFLKTAGFTFSVLSLVLLTGCIGDNGNTTQSSGIGTIQISSGVPCINLDNLNAKITGNGISAEDRGKRIYCGYLIDWDNQPDSPIIQAELSDISMWNIEDYTSSSEITKIAIPWSISLIFLLRWRSMIMETTLLRSEL